MIDPERHTCFESGDMREKIKKNQFGRSEGAKFIQNGGGNIDFRSNNGQNNYFLYKFVTSMLENNKKICLTEKFGNI